MVLLAQAEFFLRVFTTPIEEFPPTGRGHHSFRASGHHVEFQKTGHFEFHVISRHESALSCGHIIIPLPRIGWRHCA